MKRAVIGMDGFVDEVVYVVDQRISKDDYTRIMTIQDYAVRIAQGAGLSTNVDIVTIQKKIGGNGPIYAQGLKNLEVGVTYIGSIGDGEVHPIFKKFAEEIEVYCLAEPAQTDAMEFCDGKIIRSKLSSLDTVSWGTMVTRIGFDRMSELYDQADLISFNNWTMILNMNGIWEGFLKQIVPRLRSRPEDKIVFLDLADPQKRTDRDIWEALSWIREFEAVGFRTILGLNLKEATEILMVLNGKDRSALPNINLREIVEQIAGYLNLWCITVHPVDRAACWQNGQYWECMGPYCTCPILTTGAGDAYNAGFVYGQLSGCTPKECLKLGVASSGFYVRNGRTARKRELEQFMKLWQQGKLQEG